MVDFYAVLLIWLHSHLLFAYTPDWPSLDSRPLPGWYDEAKIGIFTHWGPYAVPGVSSEWFWFQYVRGDKEVVDYMKEFTAPSFRYQEFGPQLRAEFFNATQWAEIIAASGARYYVLTTKHHDGFSNWPSTKNFGWNSMDIGPKRDVVGEMATAFKQHPNLKFGLYHSLFEWFNPMYLDDKAANFTNRTYVENKVWPEIKELVTKYEPHVLWSDGDWEAKPDYWKSEELLAWLYNSSPVKDTIVTNDRWGVGTLCHHGDFYTCQDKYDPGVLQKHKWENAMTIDRKSWGYRRNMVLSDILSMEELILTLTRTVSCGGNLLVNVGPTSQGTIDAIFEERLRQMGQWLNVNGDAIYGSKPWSHQNDTIDGNVWYTAHHTQNDGVVVYGIVTEWPSSGQLQLGALSTSPQTQMTMLGFNGQVSWRKENNKVLVNLPERSKVNSEWAWTLKIVHLANGGNSIWK